MQVLQMEEASPETVLRWAWDNFRGHVAVSSSFQTQSVPLLHLVSRVCPEMPIIFLDTGFHFPETLAFRDTLRDLLGLKLEIVSAAISKSELLARYGEGLYRRDPDLCCYLNKVEPMERALSGLSAWIAGVRRDQSSRRQHLMVIEPQRSGVLKIHPMLNWTKTQVMEYIQVHDLPYHPLYFKGYRSVGCAPCTMPVMLTDDERAGRWAGTEKTECGLHLNQ